MTVGRWFARAFASTLVLVSVSAASAANLAINFGADEPNGAGSAVTGAAGVYGTANWNNVTGANGSAAGLIDGDGAATAASVEWSSPNTWSSTGRGEENNTAPAGNDKNLMTGYLDTGDTNGPHAIVTVSGLADLFTDYDVTVYIKGGVNGRGGDYTIGSETIAHLDTAAFSGTYVEGAEGDYIVFSGVTGDSFTLDSHGVNFRAPINAIEISAVPEPSTIVLAAMGLGVLAFARRRR